MGAPPTNPANLSTVMKGKIQKRTRYTSLRNGEFCCLFCHACFPNTAINDIEHHLAKHSRLGETLKLKNHLSSLISISQENCNSEFNDHFAWHFFRH